MRDLIIVLAVFLQADVTPDGAHEVSKLEQVRVNNLSVEECHLAARALNQSSPAFNAWCETTEDSNVR